MDYFKGIKTLLILKARYRELCKIHHPDIGGDLETMKFINVQYEQALKWVHDDKGERLTPERINIEKALREVLNKIVALQGIVIEITGRWIWVTGATRQYKDYLKQCGLFWASKKEAWYWRSADDRSKSRKPMTLGHIRSKYGSINIETESRQALA